MAERVELPVIPAHLTDDEAEVWRAVVNDMGAEWFRPSNLELLPAYCAHVVSLRHIRGMIGQLLEGEEGFDLRDYDRLLKMQKRETEGIASLATKMRLSQQSTYDKSKRKPDGDASKLWR